MTSAVSTRRDPRYALRTGSSTVECLGLKTNSARWIAALTRISVAGLAFETTAPPAFEVGEVIKDVTVRIEDCRLQGDLVVQDLSMPVSYSVEVGCLFYPATPGDGDRLMALIAGIEAGRIAS